MKYSNIKKITKIPTKPLYYLNVEKNENFIANNFCVHNCGYRGEIKFRFRFPEGMPFPTVRRYSEGDRIGQLIIVPYPQIEMEEVSELSDTDRGDGGFGSSGN